MLAAQPDEGPDTADYMKHSREVQLKHYNRSHCAAKDARQGNIVKRVIGGKRLRRKDMLRQTISNLSTIFLLVSTSISIHIFSM